MIEGVFGLLLSLIGTILLFIELFRSIDIERNLIAMRVVEGAITAAARYREGQIPSLELMAAIHDDNYPRRGEADKLIDSICLNVWKTLHRERLSYTTSFRELRQRVINRLIISRTSVSHIPIDASLFIQNEFQLGEELEIVRHSYWRKTIFYVAASFVLTGTALQIFSALEIDIFSNGAALLYARFLELLP